MNTELFAVFIRIMDISLACKEMKICSSISGKINQYRKFPEISVIWKLILKKFPLEVNLNLQLLLIPEVTRRKRFTSNTLPQGLFYLRFVYVPFIFLQGQTVLPERYRGIVIRECKPGVAQPPAHIAVKKRDEHGSAEFIGELVFNLCNKQIPKEIKSS